MAYGNHDPTTLKRVVSLGVAPLTLHKTDALALLRQRYLDVANEMLSAFFIHEPLRLQDGWLTSLESSLVAFQKLSHPLNKAYVEKARLEVTSLLRTQVRRHFGQIIGRLAHADEKIEQPQQERLYYYVPPAIQDKISKKELKAIAQLVPTVGVAESLAVFRRVVLERDTSSWTPLQIQVFEEIYRQTLERHRQPVLGRESDWVCQLHLDARLIRSKETLPHLDEGVNLLLDQGNGRYQSFLQLSHPIPRQAPIRLPLRLTAHQLQRLCKNHQAQMPENKPFVNSLLIEIGAERVEVKMVLARKPPTPPKLEECKHLIGRDFGYVNTASFSVARRLESLAGEEERAKIANLGKKEAKEYLSGHHLREECIVERKRYDGRKFLLCAEEICAKIDRLRSQIDRVYQKIEHQKQVLVGGLRLGVTSLVKQEEVPKDALLRRVHRRFFVLLEEVKRLKEQRRREYKRLKGLKKSWFGYVSNEEVRLLQRYEGGLVREDLTVVALKKGEERYKGRTFNKMLNNGAMGQYKRMAGQKLLWNGIAQQVLPSYWTSSVCVKCGIVDKKMRQGEKFVCNCCQDVRHADENAADTLACYLFLVAS